MSLVRLPFGGCSGTVPCPQSSVRPVPLFRFSGPEAQKLLFDVVTGRLLAEAGPAVWWALLSPQGKIQAEGLSGWADGRVLARCRCSRSPTRSSSG